MWKGSYRYFPTASHLRCSTGSYSRLSPLNAMNETQDEPGGAEGEDAPEGPQRGVSSTAAEQGATDLAARPRKPKRAKDLRVPVLPEEAAAIQRNAQAVGLTVAAYLRALGTGYEPRPVIDRDRVVDLLKVNADLGRLGGLLKLWLTNDEKLQAFDRGQMRAAIHSALRRIDENQGAVRDAVRRVLREADRP